METGRHLSANKAVAELNCTRKNTEKLVWTPHKGKLLKSLMVASELPR